ncbi:MAG: tRNA uridine-5-carboxymethylaminomethyl(34) synthesis GTPase MnmE, partial [Oscillospiraceae bacterium]|nr:tRNA uridine-5-carboxymethylaminomethyl(34) synthesis GTPase MnmE [Oscillospiraceae bacterium]
QTDDPVEQAGVALSAEKLAEADLVLALFDSSSPLSAEDEALMKQLEGKNVIAVINKTDLTPVLDEEMLSRRFDRVIHLSAKQETGVEELTAEIVALLKISELDPNAPMLANERQRQSAEAAFLAICEAREALTGGMTLDAVTISIETAAEALLALSGERITDAVVDEVFSHFCVGK